MSQLSCQVRVMAPDIPFQGIPRYYVLLRRTRVSGATIHRGGSNEEVHFVRLGVATEEVLIVKERNTSKRTPLSDNVYYVM